MTIIPVEDITDDFVVEGDNDIVMLLKNNRYKVYEDDDDDADANRLPYRFYLHWHLLLPVEDLLPPWVWNDGVIIVLTSRVLWSGWSAHSLGSPAGSCTFAFSCVDGVFSFHRKTRMTPRSPAGFHRLLLSLGRTVESWCVYYYYYHYSYSFLSSSRTVVGPMADLVVPLHPSEIELLLFYVVGVSLFSFFFQTMTLVMTMISVPT